MWRFYRATPPFRQLGFALEFGRSTFCPDGCGHFVVREPSVQIGLQLLDVAVSLPSECDLVELQQDRLEESLADPVSLLMMNLGFRVLDVIQGPGGARR
jgi:hypothetical protein